MENLPTTQENNFFMEPAAPGPSPGNALAAVEQSRAVAEVQASLVLAKANPRDENKAFNAIMQACKRKSLAECASYAFKRGGALVTGPSIRLAEVLAAQWGNITYGFREVGRGSDYSEVEAFAHDLQTNTRVTRQFQVKHFRDKRGGGTALTSERDKYELVANNAQRRVRACLLELIPGDVTEAATDACKATLTESIGNIEQKAKEIVTGFDSIGVTVDDIEGFLQREIKSIVPADVVILSRIYTSIKNGIASKSEFFKPTDQGPGKDETNINDRFAGTGDDVPLSSEPEKSKRRGRPRKEKPAEVKPDLDPEVDKVIADAKADLDTKKNIDEIDAYCQKHEKRLSNALPNNDDYMVVMAYAEDLRAIFRAAGAK